MLKSLFTALLLAMSTASFSQIFNTTPAEVNVWDPPFDPKFIAANRIAGIELSYSDKPDNKPIVNLYMRTRILFDTAGYIQEIQKINNDGKARPDTLFQWCYYNSLGLPILTRSMQGDFFFSTYYQYYPDGKLMKETRCKETNAGPNPRRFQLGVQNLISKEEFKYEAPDENTIKRLALNDEGRMYKTQFNRYDKNGRVIEETQEYTVSWVRSSTKYTYTEKGLLAEKKYISNAAGNSENRSTYEYDKLDNLSLENKYRDGQLVLEGSYLYEGNKLVSSKVVRNHAAKVIHITKYNYLLR